jgi:hypothetical protein
MTSGYTPPRSWQEHVTFHASENPYVETDSDTFVVAASLSHMGTNEGVTEKVKVVVSSDASVQDIEVEVYCLTEGRIAIASLSPAPDTPTILDMGAIANLCENCSVWEIRFRRSSGTGFVRLHSLCAKRYL